MNAPVRHIKLTANKRRILEAILVLIEEGEGAGMAPTQYEIVKSLFIADTSHLASHGRPITFDNYSALELGPVPEEAYDMLKPSYPGAKHFGEWPLWQSRPGRGAAVHYHSPKRPANRRALSASDVTALKAAFAKVRALGFAGVKDETHKHPAYVAAWRPDGGKASYKMDYSKLFPDGDAEAAADLAQASKHL